MTRKELLQEAEAIVCRDREGQYGSPEDNFGLIADMWSAYLEREISPIDVACMMCMLKIARIKTGRYRADNWTDAIGYMACGGEIDSRMEEMAEPKVIKFDRARNLEVLRDESGKVIGCKDVDTGVPYLFEKVGGPHD